MDEELRALIEKVERRIADGEAAPARAASQTGATDLDALIQSVESRVAESEKSRMQRLMELGAGATAATARGILDIPALPANIAQLATLGVEKAIGMEEPSAVSRFLASLPETRNIVASDPVLNSVLQYVAPGKLGEYVSTGFEFAGGSLAAAPVKGALRSAVRYGLVPGVASEAAGQATEGTPMEPYARAAAAIATPLATGAAGKAVQSAISPAGGQITPARQEAVELLRSEGIMPTAGQVVGGRVGERQLYREAATETGRQLAEQAAGDFTAAIMRRIGSTSTRATPEALQAADDRIGSVYDNIVQNVSAVPEPSDLSAMSQALATYRELTASQAVPPLFGNVNRELVKAFRSGNEIQAETLRTWRSRFSALTKSNDAQLRAAAIEGLDVLNRIIERALVTAGRPEAVKQLQEANMQYRNLLAVMNAVGKREDIEGIITPTSMRSALLQQGLRQYVLGKRDLSGLTSAAADIMRPLPQSGTGPRIAATQFLPNAPTGGAAGLGAFGLGVDPMIATGIGAAAALAPTMRNRFLSSSLGQQYYQNQLLGQFGPIVDQRMVGMLPGLMSDNEEPR
jgi:hypothetical protein